MSEQNQDKYKKKKKEKYKNHLPGQKDKSKWK